MIHRFINQAGNQYLITVAFSEGTGFRVINNIRPTQLAAEQCAKNIAEKCLKDRLTRLLKTRSNSLEHAGIKDQRFSLALSLKSELDKAVYVAGWICSRKDQLLSTIPAAESRYHQNYSTTMNQLIEEAYQLHQ